MISNHREMHHFLHPAKKTREDLHSLRHVFASLASLQCDGWVPFALLRRGVAAELAFSEKAAAMVHLPLLLFLLFCTKLFLLQCANHTLVPYDMCSPPSINALLPRSSKLLITGSLFFCEVEGPRGSWKP